MRGLTTADIPAWNRLLADIEQVDQTGEHYNEADLSEEMDNPDIEVGKDIVGAFDGDEMVGFFCVFPRSASQRQHRIHLDGSVHPVRRGLGVGTFLAQAMMTRAAQAHADQCPGVPAHYILSGVSDNTAQCELLAGIGLEPERWNFGMRAHLMDVAAPPALPGGLVLRTYDPSMAQGMFAAHNAAFLDHPNFTPWTEAMWRQWVTNSRNFRPEHSYLVLDDDDAPGRVASYVQTNEYDAYFEATGKREAYLAKVGTLREFRGRGLATALLQHCLKAYQEAGYDEASLDVDSQNPTGALGIYERSGFTIERKRTDYAKLAR